MKFKIIKKVDNTGTWYWTVPKGILNYLWFVLNPITLIYYFNTQNAWDCWLSLEDAKLHIQRWNSGYYKKKYYKKEVLREVGD